MGALLAFLFAVLAFAAGNLFLRLARFLKTKTKIAAFLTFAVSLVCFIPIAFFAVVCGIHIADEHIAKQEYAKKDGRLFAELYYGNRFSLSRAIAKAESLNVFDQYGTPALFVVAYRDESYASLLQKMLENGADPNLCTIDGSSPLHVAVSQSFANEKMVRTLLQHGANANLQDKDGNTPLISCVQNSAAVGSVALVLTDMLLDSGADKTLKNRAGETAADILARLMNEEAQRAAAFPDYDYRASPQYRLWTALAAKIADRN